VKLRFQADADLSESIVKGVLRRNPAIDFKTAPAAGLRSLSDTAVLAIAANEGRVLVSHDRKTMPRAFADFLRTKTSPGLILISQRTDVLAAIEWLLLAWAATEEAEWENRIVTLPL
jgi:predicted nuclease of predicted toxin-antitoxin system